MLTVLDFGDPLPHRPRRVLIAGVTGVGKTTLAKRVSRVLEVPYTEIDALYHGRDWTPRAEFMDDVQSLVAGDAWVTEWQYRSARPLLASQADLMVWLDLPYAAVTLPRVLSRTLRRRMRHEVLWNGNTEPPLRSFFTDREHVVRWSFSTRKKYRVRVPELQTYRPELSVVQLRSPRQVERWVAGPLASAAR